MARRKRNSVFVLRSTGNVAALPNSLTTKRLERLWEGVVKVGVCGLVVSSFNSARSDSSIVFATLLGNFQLNLFIFNCREDWFVLPSILRLSHCLLLVLLDDISVDAQ